MIVQHPKAPHRLEVEGNAYLIRVPSVMDRAKYRREIARQGGRRHTEMDMLGTLADGVRAIIDDDAPSEELEQRERFLEAIEDYRSNILRLAQEVTTGDTRYDPKDPEDVVVYLQRITEAMTPTALIAEIMSVVSDHYQPYRDKLADREVYDEIAAVVASRMFLVGWEGYDEPIKRTHGEVADESLEQIPANHIAQIGAMVERMMLPARKRLGNLPSGSGGRSDQKPSSSTERPKRRRNTRPSDQTAAPMAGS